MKFVTINKFGQVNNSVMRSNDRNTLYKKCGFKNNNNFSVEHTWIVDKSSIILYAKSEGRSQNINKYELPPPIDNTIYYGDIAIISLDSDGNVSEFNKEQWESIYNKLMGGFEDMENTDNETDIDEETYESDDFTREGYLKDGFIVDDDELRVEEYEAE